VITGYATLTSGVEATVEALGDPADQVSVSVFVIACFRAIAFDPRLELGEIDGGVEDADIDGSNNSLIIIE
jgi:hypothetical protein